MLSQQIRFGGLLRDLSACTFVDFLLAQLFFFHFLDVALNDGLIPRELGIRFVPGQALAGVFLPGSDRFGAFLIEIGPDFGDLGEPFLGDVVGDEAGAVLTDALFAALA